MSTLSQWANLSAVVANSDAFPEAKVFSNKGKSWSLFLSAFVVLEWGFVAMNEVHERIEKCMSVLHVEQVG